LPLQNSHRALFEKKRFTLPGTFIFLFRNPKVPEKRNDEEQPNRQREHEPPINQKPPDSFHSKVIAARYHAGKQLF
jgi:hypothetical protein